MGRSKIQLIQLMKVVEVIKTNETDSIVLERGMKWVEEIGKVSVLCNDTPGTSLSGLSRERKNITNTVFCAPFTILIIIIFLSFLPLVASNRIYRQSNSGPILDASHGPR